MAAFRLLLRSESGPAFRPASSQREQWVMRLTRCSGWRWN